MKRSIAQFLWILLLAIIPVLVIAPGSTTQGDTVGLEIPNTFPLVQTFSSGIVFQAPGAGAGTPTGAITLVAPPVATNYTLSLPGSGGTAGYYLAIGDAPGVLSYAGQSGSTEPFVTLTPTSLSFGSIQAMSSAQGSITVTNSGNAQLMFYVPPAITGDAAFTQMSTCGTTLNAGASCQVTVTFTPTASTSYSGTLTFTDTASTSPQTLALSGTGVVSPLMITSVAPGSGYAGTSFTVNGTGFTSDATVSLSGNAAQTTFSNSTRLTAVVPNITIGQYDVTVNQMSGSVTDSGAFTITTNPAYTISLTWNASVSSGVVGYNVYISTTSGGPYTRIVTLGTQTNYNDQEITPATYYYVVTAFNSTAESNYSNEVSAVVP